MGKVSLAATEEEEEKEEAQKPVCFAPQVRIPLGHACLLLGRAAPPVSRAEELLDPRNLSVAFLLKEGPLHLRSCGKRWLLPTGLDGLTGASHFPVEPFMNGISVRLLTFCPDRPTAHP